MSDLEKRLKEFLTEKNQPLEFLQLTTDASTREYFRISWSEKSAIACVYPFNDLCQGQFEACLDVTGVFLSADLPVAKIIAADPIKAIIIHEDFGDVILRNVLENSDESERENYLNEAIQLIAMIQWTTPK